MTIAYKFEGANDFSSAKLSQLANNNKLVSGLLSSTHTPNLTVAEGATLTLNTEIPAIINCNDRKPYNLDGTAYTVEAE